MQDLILCDFTMDSTTGKERGDYPKWPASKGPGYFSAFLRDMAAFMMRVKLYIFARPTVAELPAAFTPAAPAGGGGISTRARANDAAEDEAIASIPRYKSLKQTRQDTRQDKQTRRKDKTRQDKTSLRRCKCDKCGKDNHATAYHDTYERIVNKNKKAGSVSCVLRL